MKLYEKKIQQLDLQSERVSFFLCVAEIDDILLSLGFNKMS